MGAVNVVRVVTDFAAVYASFYLGYEIYFLNKPRVWADYLPELSPSLYYLPSEDHSYFTIAMGLAALVLIVYAYYDLYSEDTSILHVREYRNVLVGFGVAALTFLALYYLSFTYHPGERGREKLFSRLIFSYSCALAMAGIILGRAVLNRVQVWLHRRGIGARRILIYGTGPVGCAVARRLTEFPAFAMFPVGFLDDDPALTNTPCEFDQARGSSLPVLGTGEQLRRHVATSRADEVLIAMPDASTERVVRIVNYCMEQSIRFQFIPNVCQLAFQRTQTRDLAGIPMISVKEQSQHRVYRIAKRALDAVGSVIGCIVLAPLMAIIAVAIKLDSKGPALFAQTRVGLNGKPFLMFKFRTMHIGTPRYARTPLEQDDPRITRVGRWLRRTSFDELPQLINVVLGSMSLVGPRPEMPFIVDEYNDLQRERLKVKPGITGLWQLSADRRIAIHHNMDYDLYYVHEQSFLLDIVILVQTFFLAFKGI
jgi:exopolysaccharide biosynthesis polyprenyl glycosylphosphotransferase